jgi:chemotaxis protein CheX
MNVNFLKPFIEASAEVLEAEAGVQVTRGKLDMQKSALTTDDVTIVIHIIGDIYGVVLLGMPIQTGLNLVSSILGQDFTEWNSLAQSGVAELSNVITGRSCVKLSKAGFDVNISPPVVITGSGVQISTLDFPRIIVPLETSAGNMLVHLALREQDPTKQPENPQLADLVTISQ